MAMRSVFRHVGIEKLFRVYRLWLLDCAEKSGTLETYSHIEGCYLHTIDLQ